MEFVRITKIDKTPDVMLNDYPEISGLCRVIDAGGTEHTLGFVRVGLGEYDAINLSWQDGSDIEDGDDWSDEVIAALSREVDEIEARATQAAEAAWNEVWVEAAVAAERVSE